MTTKTRFDTGAHPIVDFWHSYLAKQIFEEATKH
jgi:hypothetical protein